MICLDELLKLKPSNERIEALAFSDTGNLAVAPFENCAYVFDPNGNLLSKVCGKRYMLDVSYCCGKFGFISYDGYVYITDENGNLIKEIKVGYACNSAITMRPNGFVACGKICAFFDFNGKEKWYAYVESVHNGPAYYKGYWYVANCGYDEGFMLIVIKDGRHVRLIGPDECADDSAICDKYLAVVNGAYLRLYDLSNPEDPKEIWKVPAFFYGKQVAFSPDCRYIAGTDKHELKIYTIHGQLAGMKHYGYSDKNEVTAVAWWKDRIAVGLRDGRVYVYRTAVLKLPFPLLTSSPR